MERQKVMYHWRTLSKTDQQALLQFRQSEHRPWHSPPHYESEDGVYVVSASCYEHRHFISHSMDRMSSFCSTLLKTIALAKVHAWVVLPNHYHLLMEIRGIRSLLKELGQMHGRLSYQWNLEENTRGRKVWFNAAETAIKSEGHFFAMLNYVLHNSVKHGYVKRWQDWPFSNAAEYLDDVGEVEALRRWRCYPLGSIGEKWDPSEL